MIAFALTESCKVDFKDPNVLYEFTLTVTPGQKVNLVLQGSKTKKLEFQLEFQPFRPAARPQILLALGKS